ncbi:MAG: toll/interleukin-1 receptor domain-containing protein [Acholeplasma sp.]|nr:toll/interleukin-1 receptor domain-containing protein [Acholeplasma sp.]
MEPISNPKVFISYAWTSNEYVDKVIAFARRLMEDGVDVLLDKFEMTPGTELNNFMEMSVKNSDVTNVLVLLNSEYARRADERKGGVGTEAQILSVEVYKNVEQTKFIPVIFEVKNGDYKSCNPVFLKSRFYIDLANIDTYEREYKNLVRLLFGKPQYRKPLLGNKPNWVDEDEKTSDVIYGLKNIAKQVQYDNLPVRLIKETINNSTDGFLNDSLFEEPSAWNNDKYYETICYMRKYRNDFIEIINTVAYETNSYLLVHDIFQNIKNRISLLPKYTSDTRIKSFLDVFLHELYIYAVSIYYKNSIFDQLGLLINMPFIEPTSKLEREEPVFFREFIYCHNSLDNFLDTYMANKNGKNYLSGKAQFWIEGVYSQLVTKNEFAEADILLTNLSITSVSKQRWAWFAVSYVYTDYESSNKIKQIAVSLKSKQLMKRFLPLFNAESKENLQIKIKQIEDYIKDNNRKSIGYQNTFHNIDLITNYVSSEEIGTIE